ncbi:DeoR family transcriptional regulator [Xylocopilactobacillus apicola]|uniref:HTH deoR-type domain-containing protein n=1 Tax=Xylocopilactobacillus apicola TaxID=2932184 RepID=A0AAU9DFJ6_9LACO|nr:DeoR family transcriptional regulator [Xylocopilactobacillus apicola]BDR58710.1 hypothetical protein XA3_11510 [Xylocopilactobacillus apicola]
MKNSLGNVYQRRNDELEYLKMHKKCSIAQLLDHFKVSSTTMNRDLALLVKKQYILREYGQIIWVGDLYQEPEILNLSAQKYQNRIVELAKNYRSIFVNASPIAAELIETLSQFTELKVITNCVPNDHSINSAQIVYLGGYLHKNHNYSFFAGDLVLKNLKLMSAEASFIYATGITEKMFTTQTLEQSLIDRTMVENTEVSYFWDGNFTIKNRGNFMISKRTTNTQVIGL